MNIVIWGGTTGMGEALAKRYFTLGQNVTVISRQREHFDENFKGKFQTVNYYQADITDREQVQKTIDELLEKQSVDIYIICAGLGLEDKTDIENFDLSEKIIQANTLGTVYAVEAIFDSMHEKKSGQIVLFGSLAGIRGLPGNSAYCASKAAIHSMGQSWASAWEKFGITVTTIAPGFVSTPHTQGNNHKMPYMSSAVDAAEWIEEAISKKELFYAFPKKPYWFMKILSILPNRLAQKILKHYKIYKKDKK